MRSDVQKNNHVSHKAILFVSNDIPIEVEEEFNHWYEEEHIPERMAIDGFKSARRYRGLHSKHSYLAMYECDGVEILENPAYLDRLVHPTERTQKIMPYFKNMVRSVCHTTWHVESSETDQAMFLVFHQPNCEYAPAARLWIKTVIRDYLHTISTVGVSLWEAAQGNVASSSPEEKLRGAKDARVGWAVFIQSADIQVIHAMLTIPALLALQQPVGLRLDYISGPYSLIWQTP